MKIGPLLIYLIPLLSTVNTCKPSSANTEPNSTTQNSVNYRPVQKIISQLKFLPSEDLTLAIRNYDRQHNTLISGDIIVVVDFLQATLSRSESDEILDEAMKSLYFYVKNLEMLLNNEEAKNDPEFIENEKKLRQFKTQYIDKLMQIYDESPKFVDIPDKMLQ